MARLSIAIRVVVAMLVAIGEQMVIVGTFTAIVFFAGWLCRGWWEQARR